MMGEPTAISAAALGAMRVRWRGAGWALCLTAAGFLLQGCCNGKYKCTGSATYRGKTYKAQAISTRTREEAMEKTLDQMCQAYCAEDDPDVDAAYRTWLKSHHPGVHRRMDMTHEPMHSAWNRCRPRCAAEIGRDTAVQCGRSGF